MSSRYAAQDTLAITLPLTANKTVTTYSDPINGTTAPYTLPGAIMEYTIAFSNPGAVDIDAGTIVITDKIPDDTDFSNVIISGGLPVVLDAGSSGLSLSGANVSYSDDDGVTYAYSPTGTIDSLVTHIRVYPTGAMAAGSSAAIRFRVELD